MKRGSLPGCLFLTTICFPSTIPSGPGKAAGLFGGARCPVLGTALLVYHGAMNLGFPEMIFIFVLALIIFGPKKMPEIGRQIGRALAEFRRASNEFKDQIETEIRQMEVETNAPQYVSEPVAPPEHTVAAGAGAGSEALPGDAPVPEVIPPAKGGDA